MSKFVFSKGALNKIAKPPQMQLLEGFDERKKWRDSMPLLHVRPKV